MKAKIIAGLTLVGGLATTACDGIGQAMTAHTDVVARAAGHELKVDKAVAFMNLNPQIPAQPDVAMAVANLWVDYVLLATAAQKDTTLRNIDLDDILTPIRHQDAITKLRERVIKVDTALTDDQLRKLWADEGMGAEIHARHILLRLAPDATPQQRDSVTKLAQSLRDQARGGADFGELARKYSADGSAQQGGLLEWTPKGGFVAQFEEAAYKLEPGQISDLVESPFGIHVIKLEGKRSKPFDEANLANYRQSTVTKRVRDAELAYLKKLTDSLKFEVQEGAVEVVRDMAAKPASEMKGRAGARALVKYEGGGEFTAAEFGEMLRTAIDQQTRAAIPQGSEEDIKGFLQTLTRQEVLVNEAEKLDLAIAPARLDSIRTQIYTQLQMAASQAGLTNIQPQDGESRDEAIERRVNALIESTIKGEQNVIPLGALSFSLRKQFNGEVFERALPTVVSKVQASRPPQPQLPPGMQLPPQGAPPTGVPPAGAPPTGGPPPTTTTGN